MTIKPPSPSRPLTRLTQTLSSISGEVDMAAAREVLDAEKGRLDLSSPPPKGYGFDATKRLPPQDNPSTIKDLKDTGKIASDFMLGIDNITDVLTILVMKFGRASRMLQLVMVCIILGVISFIFAIAMLWSVTAQLERVQVEQSQLKKSLAVQVTTILNKTDEVAKKAQAAVDAAEAIEKASPKIVFNDEGDPTLVVQGDSTAPPPPPDTKPAKRRRKKTPQRNGKTVEFPLGI